SQTFPLNFLDPWRAHAWNNGDRRPKILASGTCSPHSLCCAFPFCAVRVSDRRAEQFDVRVGLRERHLARSSWLVLQLSGLLSGSPRRGLLDKSLWLVDASGMATKHRGAFPAPRRHNRQPT